MKIAEALLLRADMQKKLASLRERIGRNAVVQDGGIDDIQLWEWTESITRCAL